MVLGTLFYLSLNHLMRLLARDNFIQIETLKSTFSRTRCNGVKVNSEIIYSEKKNMSFILALYNLEKYKKLPVKRVEIGVALKSM